MPHRRRLYQPDAPDGSLLPVADLPTEHHPDSRPPLLRRHPFVQQVLLKTEGGESEGVSEGVKNYVASGMSLQRVV